MWPRLRRDLDRLAEIKSWGTLRALFDGLFLDAGFQALIAHRCAHTLKKRGVPLLPALLRRLSIAACAIDIVPQADIGGGCYIPHGIGIVVGGRSVVGENCTLLQGVTLGEARFSTSDCPRIGDRVVLGAGCKVLGGVRVGDDCFVGANSVVLDDLPAGSVAVGAPAVARPRSDRT